jgi:hypothetical protein
VEDHEIADSRRLRVIPLKQSLHGFGDVEDFAFLAGLEGDPLHEMVEENGAVSRAQVIMNKSAGETSENARRSIDSSND